MNKTKKLQIPISAEDEKTIRTVAKIYQVSAAEWVRNPIMRAAQRDLFRESLTNPKLVLQKLANQNAPVGSVKKMKEQSTRGRFS